MLNLKELRRVVTGHDSGGKSVVVIDGPPGTVVGGGVAELWITDTTPADNFAAGDSAVCELRLEPPPNGSIFRFFAIPPEDPSVSRSDMEKTMAAAMQAVGAGHNRPDTTRHPGMHTTDTVDYIVLLTGEVTLLLDKTEVNLKPFDTVVQRGTNHAWVNRGKEPALAVGVLISAKPARKA